MVAGRHRGKRFVPFLGLPPELRKIIYATNAIESGKLVEGSTVLGWKHALGALTLAYPERIGTYLT